MGMPPVENHVLKNFDPRLFDQLLPYKLGTAKEIKEV